MISALFGDALAKVPAVCRVAARDASVRDIGRRLEGLPWLVADLPPAKRDAVLESAADLLAEALGVARALHRVDGYHPVFLAMYGVLAGLLGCEMPVLSHG